MKVMIPKLDILPPEQRKVWPLLSQVPKNFTLYGGTAIALRLGHRISIDFDFFSHTRIDNEQLLETIPFLQNAEIIVNNDEQLSYIVSGVKFEFLDFQGIGIIEPPEIAEENSIKIASLTDLLATRLKVIIQRTSWKDYSDIHEILSKTDISLERGLAAAIHLFDTNKSNFSPMVSLKTLGYFDKLDVTKLSENVRIDLLKFIQNTSADKLKQELENIRNNNEKST